MKLTPMDIQQVAFKVRFRGYDKEEVDSFLDTVCAELEARIKEDTDLREKLASMEIQMGELKKKETALTNTLLSVQHATEEMKSAAQREAALIVKEAEVKAEEIAKEARGEKTQILRELADLQRQKVLFLERMKTLVKSFEKSMEVEEEMAQDNNPRPIKPQ